MGRIKSGIVKRTTRQLIEKSPECFDKTFETNKTSLGSTMSSKKVRNKIAGYIARVNKQKKNILEEESEDE
jgi:small subunit ribosomal protein S17e